MFNILFLYYNCLRTWSSNRFFLAQLLIGFKKLVFKGLTLLQITFSASILSHPGLKVTQETCDN